MNASSSSTIEECQSACAWIHSCLDTCNSQHKCQPDPRQRQQDGKSPDWVIDVIQCNIVPGSSINQYVALSYVWNNDTSPSDGPDSVRPERLMLKQHNLYDFQQPGFLQHCFEATLPRIIRDAVHLVRALGLKYLWVDALCIVQDAKDTRAKVERMDEVYAGAYFTIIAAVSWSLVDSLRSVEDIDSNTQSEDWTMKLKQRFYGLSRKIRLSGSSRVMRPENLDNHGRSPCLCGKEYAAYVQQHGITGPIDRGEESRIYEAFEEKESSILHRELRITFLYKSLQESKWATRGWTFQEQVLSKRAVMCVDDLLFWDCECCIWDATILKPITGSVLARNRGSRKPSYERTAPIQLAREVPVFKKDFRTWFELICLYNSRDFTFPQDALMAFSGILNLLSIEPFKGDFPNGFIAGLPKDFLDAALLWQPLQNSIRRTATPECPLVYLPSWSPLGWKCPIDPYSLRSGLAHLNDGENRELAATWRTYKSISWSIQNGIGPSSSHCLEFMTTKASFEGFPIEEKTEYDVRCTKKLRDTEYSRKSNFIPSTLLHMMMQKESIVTLFAQFSIGTYTDFCKILRLSSGGKAVGLLRQMDSTPIASGTNVELIAISLGSAARCDLSKAFEERLDQIERDYASLMSRYQFEKESPQAIRLNRDDGRVTPYQEPYYGEGNEDALIEFYNVLWIERDGDVVYRKAVGRVSKSAWDENCSSPIQVNLA